MPYADFDRFRYVDNSGEAETVSSVLVSTFTDAPRGSAFGIMLGTGNFQDFLPADLQLPAGDVKNLFYVRLSLHSPAFRLSHWMYKAPANRRIQRVELSIDIVTVPGGPDYYRATRLVYLSRSNGVIDAPVTDTSDLNYVLDFPPTQPAILTSPHIGGKPRMLLKGKGKKPMPKRKAKRGSKGKAGAKAAEKSEQVR